VSVTVKRWGGPYDQVNGNVAPYGVDRFDAMKSIHSTAEMVGTQLKRDFDKTLDTFIGAYLSLGATSLYTNGYTATTSFYGGASSPTLNAAGYGEAPMSLAMIRYIERSMLAANLPMFPNGRYALVLPAVGIQELGDDPQWIKSSEFHPPVNVILAKSYYRTSGKMDIFISNSLPTTNNGNTSATVYIGQAFAPGVLGSGLAMMPRVAKSSADNYGEWALLVWLMYAGFSLLDSRFVYPVYFN
jgi:hypothetical protein